MLMNNDTFTIPSLEVQFGHYKLYRVLRRSRVSTLYLGEHLHLHNTVAIKVLNNWVANDTALCKFSLGARLHANLRHPHIVRVLDYGMRGQLPFMVMDYALHGTLHDYFLIGRSYSLDVLLPFVMQIASGLHYIHTHNMIHRDIKPQNILLDATNTAQISDFGIAVAVQPWSQHQQQESMGTALFAAPEQIDGRPLTASDQYSLAVMVYTWLCGHPPFTGTSLQLCKQHLYSQPRSLRTFIPTLSPNVERVVLKALSKDPYQRFADVQDFAYALHDAAQEYHTDPLPAISGVPRLHAQIYHTAL